MHSCLPALYCIVAAVLSSEVGSSTGATMTSSQSVGSVGASGVGVVGAGEEHLIGYADFMKAKDASAQKCTTFFTATVFAKLYMGDRYGRISVVNFFNYVMRKVPCLIKRVSNMHVHMHI